MEEEKSLEDIALNSLFKEEKKNNEAEIVDIAQKYSLQLNIRQIKAILYLNYIKNDLKNNDKAKIEEFIKKYIELKIHNASASFIIKILENIALKKFINEDTFKININKKE